ncbi:MAG: exodeoxyribonuclease VII large subunit [Clostridia bacterium]|nr:exodeoxyribonuclease VII large subunit [Clostridia bacterium]
MERSVLSVKQLNMYVKSLVEGDERLAFVSIKGEISNFKNHFSSGHFYFTLKDNDAAIRCVMFRSYASAVKFRPEDGMEVILTGRVSIYERDGQYQFYAEEMHNAGQGDISVQFEQIKKKLAEEGLFDEESKRPIPKFPENIAVVTSNTGAAVQDIMNILSRRYPLARVIMCPVAVQGELAVPDMVNTLERIYALNNVDLIIIGRGGGSIEDLWAFNSEALARKIYESPIPVISAVGHETDFTICDFVADLRAPTPSAAAELAVPNSAELKNKIEKLQSNMCSLLRAKYNYCATRFDAVTASPMLKKPLDALIFDRYEHLDKLSEKIFTLTEKKINEREKQFSLLSSVLETLSPLKVINRGYAVAEANGEIVKSIYQVKIGDSLNLRLNDGRLTCQITEKEQTNE